MNLQGDVVAILTKTGTVVVEYTYDAWGNILSITGSMASTLGVQNPFRYRGYVYDQETGLYYLQSRYYNPEWGRFLNADAYASTGQGFIGNNMFAYCLNNPVNYSDESGEHADSYSGWAGEEIGMFIYELITGDEHPDRKMQEIENEIIMEQNEIIGDAASSVWDAYMRGYTIQQEKQMQQDMATLNGALKVYEYYKYINENEFVKAGKAYKKVDKGVHLIMKGAEYIMAPVPTPIDDVVGVGIATAGVIYAVYGLTEAIIWIDDLNS